MGNNKPVNNPRTPGRSRASTVTVQATPVRKKGTVRANRSPGQIRQPGSFKNIPYLVIFLFLSIFICLTAPVIGGGIAYISIQQSSKILPNTTTIGLPIGQKTVTEAFEFLDQAGNLSHIVQITNQFVIQSIPISDLGISIDAIRTAEKAYLMGRSGNFISRLKTIFQAYTNGNVVVEPIFMVDIIQAQAGLATLTPFFSQPPIEASFYLDNDQIKALPGKIGYTLDVENAILLIRGNPENIYYSHSITVPLRPVLPAKTDLTSLLPEAKRFVETPLELIFYDPILDEWMTETIPKSTLLEWLTVSHTGNGDTLQINPARIADYLAIINQKFSPNRLINIDNASYQVMDTITNQSHPVILIQHQPAAYVVQPGDTLLRIGWKLGFPYWQIIDANPLIDPEQIAPGTEIYIPSKNVLLPLPVVLHKRIIISIDQQRLWVYEYGKQKQNFVISTGIDRSPTQPGIFQVQTHVRSAYASIWDLTMPNFLGIYEAWPGFMNGIHGLPTLSNGRILWANILGKPASYGCIILNLDAADWLYQWAEDGVIVEIRP